MSALVLAIASLALAASAPAEVLREVRWILGPASVELDGGRVRCSLPDGLALASGAEAVAILGTVAGGADGSELAVVSPVAPSKTWFVVLRWQERPRGDDRAGRVRWAWADAGGGDEAVVNQHVQIRASGGALLVTLVTPADELAEARPQLERIVEGLRVAELASNAKRR